MKTILLATLLTLALPVVAAEQTYLQLASTLVRELDRLRRTWETKGAKLVVYGDRRLGGAL